MSGSGYLSGQPPPPLAITSGAGQDQDVDRKRKDYNPGGYGCNGTTRCSCCACVMFDGASLTIVEHRVMASEVSGDAATLGRW